MRIAMVATYPPIECGIGTYTQYLTDALLLKENELSVISQAGGKGDIVFPAYAADTKTIASDIFDMVNKLTPDVLHVQHEFGLFGEREKFFGVQILEVLARARIVGLPVVTTFHTVFDVMAHEEQIIQDTILRQSAAVIVHEDYHRETLRKYLGDDCIHKISVIPHGVREVDPVPDARRLVGVEGKTVLMLCGYLRETKRFDKVIRLFQRVAAEVQDAVLVMAGKSRGIDRPPFMHEIYRLIEESPVSDRIVVLHGQIPQKTFDTLLSAADVVPMPYEKGGQSGIMAQCFAFRVPVVTSPLRAFRRWIDLSGGGFVGETDEEFEQHVITLMKDKDLRLRCRKSIDTFVREQVAWSVIADRHMEVYNAVVTPPSPSSRHVYWG